MEGNSNSRENNQKRNKIKKRHFKQMVAMIA
jgi:hypothetical protein